MGLDSFHCYYTGGNMAENKIPDRLALIERLAKERAADRRQNSDSIKEESYQDYTCSKDAIALFYAIVKYPYDFNLIQQLIIPGTPYGAEAAYEEIYRIKIDDGRDRTTYNAVWYALVKHHYHKQVPGTQVPSTKENPRYLDIVKLLIENGNGEELAFLVKRNVSGRGHTEISTSGAGHLFGNSITRIEEVGGLRCSSYLISIGVIHKGPKEVLGDHFEILSYLLRRGGGVGLVIIPFTWRTLLEQTQTSLSGKLDVAYALFLGATYYTPAPHGIFPDTDYLNGEFLNKQALDKLGCINTHLAIFTVNDLKRAIHHFTISQLKQLSKTLEVRYTNIASKSHAYIREAATYLGGKSNYSYWVSNHDLGKKLHQRILDELRKTLDFVKQVLQQPVSSNEKLQLFSTTVLDLIKDKNKKKSDSLTSKSAEMIRYITFLIQHLKTAAPDLTKGEEYKILVGCFAELLDKKKKHHGEDKPIPSYFISNILNPILLMNQFEIGKSGNLIAVDHTACKELYKQYVSACSFDVACFVINDRLKLYQDQKKGRDQKEIDTLIKLTASGQQNSNAQVLVGHIIHMHKQRKSTSGFFTDPFVVCLKKIEDQLTELELKNNMSDEALTALAAKSN
jgi:hypothetical protein